MRISGGVTAESDVTALVQVAVQECGSSIADILHTIAERLEAFGCVLWDVVPGAKLEASPPQGQLFVLAAWFPTGELFAMHDLELKYTTGQVVLSGNSRSGVAGEPGIELLDHPFLRRHAIDQICSAPLHFLNGSPGAVTLYRRHEMPRFCRTHETRLKACASVLPQLCQAVRDKISLELLNRIEIILQGAEWKAAQPLGIEAEQAILQEICDATGSAFSCLEVSVYLENRLQKKGVYQLQATTRKNWIKKIEYRGEKEEGLTGWVLAERKPLKLFDLAKFNAEDAFVQGNYPGLIWKDPLKVNSLPLEEFLVTTEAEKPPLSFMAAPCLVGTELLGAIRCSTATRGPFYFADRELNLLRLVAALIGQSWYSWLNRCEIQQETESWRSIIRSLGQLNDFLAGRVLIGKESPDEKTVLQEGLRVTSSVIPGAEMNSVRLFDPRTRELYFAAVSDRVWPQVKNKDEIKQGLERRFPTDGEPGSAGAWVFQNKQTYVMNSPVADPFYKPIFSEVTSMLIVPIQSGGCVQGVLDLRWRNNSPVPGHAREAAELIGRQLGLYRDFVESVNALKSAKANAKDEEERHRRMVEDLAHQLKGPLAQALARANHAVDKAEGTTDRLQLVAVRGLCRKARRVSTSMRILADLSGGRPILLKLEALREDALLKLLIEMASDTEITIDPRRRIRFVVEREKFQNAWSGRISVDTDLLEQALGNLYDNAAKYSYDNTTVRVHGGFSQTGRFYIGIANKGIPIREGDARKCTIRGWRSEEAKWVTGEGSGLGLWIVDQIMCAHHGELEIIRRNADGLTEVRIYFNQTRSEVSETHLY